ncbi:MAG: hypothetical protein E3J56_07115 [Candidatus Aminicenantes bacterium]|nr:MAG: hypothetical protein E3J56_07115 [Candidatus Aminicenantes bacterium]
MELERQIETQEGKVLKLKDERDFYSLIDRRLKQQGFEVVETFVHLSGENNYREPSFQTY